MRHTTSKATMIRTPTLQVIVLNAKRSLVPKATRSEVLLKCFCVRMPSHCITHVNMPIARDVI